ncbi:ABC transporter family protein (macronuclear) [Tetrahymena thermophila SB210]|uniref:ABC transporter family protein n=1 Tax=Tetrahymena thermophila (strain SB210) TaxID=312017 RepID=Q22P35_TETTS|nr:ABC transporter family protein [Tetrahymena thermophila SB210]EAR86976.1 ABC transporter family protein [Tetrahymena thermophila SB210]|eukprot:XP_001007221.1 ABC transporter family protein [Tetrahymena thermophila SB210]
MKRLDLFGSQIQFRFQGEKSFNTSLGVLFTVGIATIIILRLVILLNDIYQRNNPVVIQQQRQVSSPEKFVMDRYSLPFAFGLQGGDNLDHYIDPTIYTVTAQQNTKVPYVDENGQTQYTIQVTDVNVSICTQDSFKNPATKQGFLDLPYQQLFCIDPQQVVIEGDYTQQNFSQFQIKLHPCTGQGCGDTKKLGRGYFAIYFQDVIVNPKNKDQPFEYFNRDLFWTSSSSTPKEVDMYFVNNYVQSDYGWVTSDIQTLRYPSYSEQDNSYTSDVDYFFMLNLRFQKQKENIYSRNYKNLTNVVSEIGGFAQSILAIGFIICSTLSEIMLNKSIINEAFDFKIKNMNPQNNEISNLQQPKISVGQSNDNTSLNQKLGQNVNINQEINQKKQIQQQKNIQLESFVNIQSPVKIQKKAKQVNFNQIENINQIPTQPQQQITLEQKTYDQEHTISNTQTQSSIKILSQIVKKKFASITNSQKQSKLENQSQNLIEESQNKEKKLKQNKSLSDEEFKKLLNKERSDMSLSVVEYLKYFFWPFGEIKKKKQIIDYSVQKLYYHLDLMYVIKKLLEVDKLKELVMDKDQIQLFEYISKPVITDEEVFSQLNKDQLYQKQQQKYNILYQDNRSEIQKAQDAYLSYQNIQNRDKKTLMDQKILRHLDPQLLGIFNYQELQQQNNSSALNLQPLIQPSIGQINQNCLENQINSTNQLKNTQNINNQADSISGPQQNIFFSPRSELEILEEKQQFTSSSEEEQQIPTEENNQDAVNRTINIPQNQIKKQKQ